MSKKTIFILIAVVVLLGVSVFGSIKFIRFEQNQNENIITLVHSISEQNEIILEQNEKIERLSRQIQDVNLANLREKEYYKNDFRWGEGYNWLALGNSMTIIDGYGHGMCSTQMDNDYFGLVKKYLEGRYGTVNTYRHNFVLWEMEPNNRSFKMFHIEHYLTPEVDLVTLQLGENASNVTTYKDDLVELINHIKGTCPKAKIIMIDDFWYDGISNLRKAAAEETGIPFADLSEIRGKTEYHSKEGTVFVTEEGTETVYKAAETHPGDKGMKYIADKVIAILEQE